MSAEPTYTVSMPCTHKPLLEVVEVVVTLLTILKVLRE